MPEGTVLSADVCIVGAGPAGITIARELGRAGVRVLLLESGGRDPERFSAGLNRGESVGRPYFRLERSRIRAFAGTSRHWLDDGYRSRPLDEIDFERRDAVPHSGWPFPRSELDGHYERAQEASQLSGVPFDDEAWGAPLDAELAERGAGSCGPPSSGSVPACPCSSTPTTRSSTGSRRSTWCCTPP
jgi:choline dehydrogenase-like flavoprotein